MEGGPHSHFDNSASFMVLSASSNDPNNIESHTSVTPPYFKTEPMDDHLGQMSCSSSHSVDRLIMQEYKPTISPALLSAVEQVTQETSRLHQQTPTGAQQQTSVAHQPLPQLNTLVRSIGRSPTEGSLMNNSGYLGTEQQMISPGRLSAAPSNASGSNLGSNVGNPMDGCPRQHPCPDCGKHFPNNSALAKHRLIHSDERKFICDICQKAFKRQDHLNGHLNVHKTVKPFPCIADGCDKSYCDARSLRRHLEHSHNVQNPIVHSSRGTVYVKCEDYETTIESNRSDFASGNDSGESAGHDSAELLSGDTSPTDLLDAESGMDPQNILGSDLGSVAHSGQNQITCNQCGRGFKNIPALNGHMRLHSQGKSSVNNNLANSVSNDGAVFFSNETSESSTPIGQSPSQSMLAYANFQSINQPLNGDMTDMMPSDMIYSNQHQALDDQQYHHSQSLHQQQQQNHAGLHQCYSEGSMHDYIAGQQQCEIPDSLPMQSSYMEENNLHDIHISPLHINVINHCHGQQTSGQMNSGHMMTGQMADLCADSHAIAMNSNNLLISSKNLNQALSVIVPPQSNSPYYPMQHEDHDSSLFPELDMPSGSGFGYSGHQNIGETPLDLGPDLSKDVDDEVIRRELELLCENSTYGASFNISALNDDDDDFFGNSKLFERKRHLTAPSSLLSAAHSNLVHNGSSSSSVSQSSKHQSSQVGVQKPSRPLSRLRRKSRGKPDNVFMLLNQSWRRSPTSKRRSQLPLSPVRFRKHLSGNGNYPGLTTSSGRHHRLSLSGKSGRHRPAPLIIPAPVPLNRFHSQLRSPRLWIETPAAHTPYTPPPMLSPVRKGSGLFWRINLAFSAINGPQSAPISPKFCKEVWTRGILPAEHVSVCEQEIQEEIDALPVEVQKIIKSSPDSIDSQPPETDTNPHINIGSQYQAEIPELLERRIVFDDAHPADLVFDASCLDDRDDEEVDAYIEFSCSNAVIGGCRNKEYALHLLHQAGGNIEQSVLLLMNSRCMLNADTTLYGYEYVDSMMWTVEQMRHFQDALIRNDKDFFLVASHVKNKTVKQCVAFYYTWKKCFPDEYRRLKWMRRRRELPEALQQPNAYNLRSCFDIVPQETMANKPLECVEASPRNCDSAERQPHHREPVDEQMHDEIEHILDFISSKTETPAIVENKTRPTPVTVPVVQQPKPKLTHNTEGIFPCRLCEKVFYKVKSRNAHMKSHSTKCGS